MDKRIGEIERWLMPINHRRAVDAARTISSDVLGLNLRLDEVEKDGRLETIPVSGFERVRRTKQAT